MGSRSRPRNETESSTPRGLAGNGVRDERASDLWWLVLLCLRSLDTDNGSMGMGEHAEGFSTRARICKPAHLTLPVVRNVTPLYGVSRKWRATRLLTVSMSRQVVEASADVRHWVLWYMYFQSRLIFVVRMQMLSLCSPFEMFRKLFSTVTNGNGF